MYLNTHSDIRESSFFIMIIECYLGLCILVKSNDYIHYYYIIFKKCNCDTITNEKL